MIGILRAIGGIAARTSGSSKLLQTPSEETAGTKCQ